MKTIFLFIPIYVYISDFLRTEYIKYLSSKYKVFIFVPSGFFENKNDYFKSPNVEYIKWNLQFPKFWIFFRGLLRYCLIRRFDYEPVHRRRHQGSGFRDWKRKLIRPFAYLFPKNFITTDIFDKLEEFFLPQSEIFQKYCQQYRPSLILTATPGFNHYDAEVIALAKKNGQKTASINFSWDNLHSGSKNIRKPDYLIVWNDIIKKTAQDMHNFKESQIFVSGIIRFDHYFAQKEKELSREEFLISKGLDLNEKTILITTVTDGNYPLEKEMIKRLLEEREKGKLEGFPNIFIRLHPKDNLSKYEEFLSRKNVIVEEAGKEMKIELGTKIEMDEDDLMNLKYTLKYCDVVINYASTITLEACIFDKPIINIGFPEYYLNAYSFSHYKPIVDIGAIKLARSFEEMLEQINFYFKKPHSENQNRKKIVEEFIKFTDGLSYKRNVDLLDKII